MRHEDASRTGSFSSDSVQHESGSVEMAMAQSQPASASAANPLPTANDDVDGLTRGGPSSTDGNVITGAGTSGETAGSGTDIVGADGATVQNAGTHNGTYGVLALNADGSYTYTLSGAGQAAIDSLQPGQKLLDTFGYTLVDGSGDTDGAQLTIILNGNTDPRLETKLTPGAGQTQVVPGPDGVVVLPEGVELSDIHVVGRNLVIDLPDGTQMVIVDGAVFVPQLVLGSVEVPATNLAALMIDAELRPAAGSPDPASQSGGGNFIVDVSPLDPGVPLGDLLPPTQLDYSPPDQEEIGQFIDNDPEILIQTPDQPAGVENATAVVDEAALGVREGEPEGSNAASPNESVSGTIVYDSPDDPNSITINGVPFVGVGQVIPGAYGSLLITSVGDGTIGYLYTLADNIDHAGNPAPTDLFTVTITDSDGDSDTATLTIGILDDVPTARNDVDSLLGGDTGPAEGNVVTGVGTTSGSVGADTLGADDAEVLGIRLGASGTFTPVDGDGVTIPGLYGTLTIFQDGEYSYVRNSDAPGNQVDIFNYQLVDTDGDPSIAELRIIIEDAGPDITNIPAAGSAGAQVFEAGLNDPEGSNAASNSEFTSGTITFTAGDGATRVFIDGEEVTAAGQTFSGTYGTLTIISIGSGAINYSYELTTNTIGNATSDDFALTIRDADGDSDSGTLTIAIVDDIPDAVNDTDTVAGGIGGHATGNVMTGADTTTPPPGGADVEGADSAEITNVVGYLGDSDSRPFGNADTVMVVDGQYGTLTINADGSYDYARDAGTPGGVTDSFTYTLTDGDTDSDTATLTISIPNVPPTVTVTDSLPNDLAADNQVFEKGLPERAGEPAGSGEIADGIGTDNDDPSEQTSGTITFNSVDGVQSMTFTLPGGGTVTLTEAQLATLTGSTSIVVTDTAGYSLSVSNYSYNPATGAGSLAYTFTLDDNTLGNQLIDGGNTSVAFGVVVTDDDGQASPSDTLTIKIVDDAPTAVADTDSVTEDGPPATGNVITDAEGDGGEDTEGADGALVQVPDTYLGNFGTLVIDADGDYTYTLYTQAQNPAAWATIQALGAGETQSDQFDYVLQDNDGDTSPSTLTITINGANDAPPTFAVSVVVSEEGLPAGNPDSNPVPTDDTNAVFAQGDLTLSDPDGDPLTLTLGVPSGSYFSGGVPISWVVSPDGNTLTGSIPGITDPVPIITVTLTDAGHYEVTLSGQLDHPDPTIEDELSITVPVSVSDGTTTTAATITIQVEDDMPAQLSASVTAAVDEDELPNGITDGDLETTVATGSLAGLASAGADQPGTFSFDATALGGLPALTSGGATISYAVVGGVLVAYTGSNSATTANYVFTVSLTSSGSYTVTLLNQVDHLPNVPANSDEQVLTLDLSGAVKLTDADGDSIHLDAGSFNVEIEDDIPVQTQASVTAAVDEDELPNGITDSDLETTVATGSLAGLASAGADQPGTFSFDATALGGLPALTSGGATISYAVVGGVLVAYTGSNSATTANYVFTVSLTSSGSYTVTLLNQVDHLPNVPADGDEQLLTLDLSGAVRLTDADGDSIHLDAGSFNVEIEDDIPTSFDPDPITSGLENEIGATATADLDTDGDINNNIGNNNIGADRPGTITFANIVDGQDTTQTSGGVMIELWLSDDGQTLEGRTGSTDGINGTLIYTVQLNQADGDYTFTLAQTIDNGSGVTFADLSGGVAGNPPFKLIQSSSADNMELLITPINETSVNSDSDDIAAGSQFIDIGNPDKGLRIDFGDFTYDANGGGTSDDAFVINNHETINGFRFTIDQISNGTTADVRVAVYNADEDGGAEEQTPNPTGDTLLTITSVKLYNASGVLVDTYTSDTTVGAIGIDFESGGTVLITDLPSDYSIQTFTASGYDRIEITNAGIADTTDGKFSLSQLSIETADSGDPINLTYDLQLTDADGDTVLVEDALAITISPAVAPVVLDLGDAGIDFLSRDAGVTYDYNGDGNAEATAWVAAGDGILVHDANANGIVDNASEFVFGSGGTTDLEALSALYGETLDGEDAAFDEFAVWQDDGDGVFEAGELTSLADMGITSIGLVSDGDAYTAAGGDVQVAGTATYTIGGVTRDVADASFKIGGPTASNENERILGAANSNASLAIALAAASLITAPAAAQDNAAAPDQLAALDATFVLPDTSPPTSDLDGSAIRSELGGEIREAVADEVSSTPGSADASGDDSDGDGGSASAGHEAPVASDLLEATDVAAQGQTAGSLVDTSDMPSADALIAAQQAPGDAGQAGPGEADGMLSQILADALRGGGGQAVIDSILDHLAAGDGSAGQQAGISSANLVDAGVSGWDMGHDGGYAAAAAAFTMEALMLHQDAAQLATFA